MPTVDSSERDNKETLLVKEEVTNDAEVFGEVVKDVEGCKGATEALLPVGAPKPCSEAGCHIAKADAHVRASLLLDVLLHIVEKASRRFREGAVAAKRKDDVACA